LGGGEGGDRSQIAEVFAGDGDGDAAFEWLERALANRDAGLARLKTNPRFRSLHGDPRWRLALQKAGLENMDE
jgi:hypothetical protein